MHEKQGNFNKSEEDWQALTQQTKRPNMHKVRTKHEAKGKGGGKAIYVGEQNSECTSQSRQKNRF